MKGETIFRFFSVRPAAPARLTGDARLLIDPFALIEKKTAFYEALEKAAHEKTPREKLLAAVRSFMASPAFAERVSALDPDLSDLVEWFYENRRLPARDALGTKQFAELTGPDNDGKMTPALTEQYARLVDSVIALAVAGKSSKRQSEELVLAAKLLNFRYGEPFVAPEGESLGSFTAKYLLSLPPFLDDVLYAPKETRAARPAPGPKTAEANAHLEALQRAHSEISAVLRFANALATVSATPNRGGTEDGGISPAQHSDLNIRARLSADAISELSSTTLNLLSAMKLDINSTDPFRLISRIERDIQAAAAAIAEPEASGVLSLGGALLDILKFKAAFAAPNAPASTGIATKTLLESCTYAAGIADLLLVRQQLKGYRLGEIAHVENVLQGEKRERNHRRLNRVTDEFFTEEEREETKERDLETTERNELQTEMSTTATTELSLDAGVQVSGSFGPSVSFDSQVDSSFSSTVEESERKATNFSRNLSEKSSEKIRERVKRERRKISVEEIEEINQHRFENTGSGNIRGVYRWLDKIYEAQVFSYGQRMMFDFVLPEPAAYFLFALIDSPPEALNIPKPAAPVFFKQPLSPANLTRTNYQKYIRQYGVTNAPEPPPAHLTVSYTDKQEGNNSSDYARAATLELPEHYEAYKAAVVCDHVARNDDHSVHIMAGGRFVNANVSGWVVAEFAEARQKQLSVAIHCRNVKNFSAAIDVFCELTPEGFAAWQNKVYEAIMEAYQLRLAEFEEKVATASVRRGPAGPPGSDPASNRAIICEELRKLALMLLTSNSEPGLNSFKNQEEPVIDPLKACANGAIIRFFENAFEWNNMAYILYPYFWGRKARWSQALQLTGTDNDFTAFLKAGAARMQLAVRPGFEKAVVHFIQFGEIWEGNDPPLVEDDLYVPIVQEIAENLQRPEEATPYPVNGKPWEVSLPTSLVYLQEEVPEFEDPLEA